MLDSLTEINKSVYKVSVLLQIVNDLLLAMDEGNWSALFLLDLNAAFDNIDHNILLYRQHDVFCIQSSVLS